MITESVWTDFCIIIIERFVEQTFVCSLHQIYNNYSAAQLRFSRMLYRCFASANHFVPIPVAIERLVQWDDWTAYSLRGTDSLKLETGGRITVDGWVDSLQ